MRQDELAITEDYIDKLGIATPGPEQRTLLLSGGNQQKVVFAKLAATQSAALIPHEPSQGVDVQAKVDIFNFINDLSRQGVAIMIISSEIRELIGLGDRVLVMYEGRITNEFSRAADDMLPCWRSRKGRAMRTPNRHGLIEFLTGQVVWVVLVFTVVVVGLMIKGYLGLENVANILITGGVLGVMVIGQSLCLMARKLDLSAEGTVSLVAAVAARLILHYRETYLSQAGGLGVELDPLIVIPFILA